MIVEVLRKLSRTKSQIQEQKLDRSSKCRGAIEEAGAFSIDPLGIEEVSRLCLKKCLRSSTDSKVSRRCQGGVETAFQNSFSRCEKHKYECNPTYNLTNDPINTKISQNSLSVQKKLSTRISKTHTHTLNKSNQFYISKISHDSLVSIHYYM